MCVCVCVCVSVCVRRKKVKWKKDMFDGLFIYQRVSTLSKYKNILSKSFLYKK